MRALLTSVMVAEIASEADARALAAEVDRAVPLNMASVAEREGVPLSVVAEQIQYLGTAVTVIE